MTFKHFWELVKQDFRDFYTLATLKRFLIVFSVAFLLANSAMDETVRHYYQSQVRSARSDYLAKRAKFLGERGEMMLIYTGITVAGIALGSQLAVFRWGQQVLRGLIVGSPLLWLTQFTTGGSRPTEGHSSRWKPFTDNNGASGHSFIGSMPFHAAASRVTHPAIKALLYLFSWATPWSRINDEAHYLSQILLGWWLAFRMIQVQRNR